MGELDLGKNWLVWSGCELNCYLGQLCGCGIGGKCLD